MTDNRNTILAIILSGLVLLGWQYFFNIPQMEKQRAAQQAQSQMTKPAQQTGNPQTRNPPAS
jgi:YidC/Oxa1 family membrane protein insertase